MNVSSPTKTARTRPYIYTAENGRIHDPYTAVYTTRYMAVYGRETAVFGRVDGRTRPCTRRHVDSCTRPYTCREHGRVHGPYTAVYMCCVRGRVRAMYTTEDVRTDGPYTVMYTGGVDGHGPYTAVYGPCIRHGRYTAVYGPFSWAKTCSAAVYTAAV